jgi:hypothetical protein
VLKRYLKRFIEKGEYNMNSYKRVLEILKTTLNRWAEDEYTPEEHKNIYKNLLEYIRTIEEIYGEEEK